MSTGGWGPSMEWMTWLWIRRARGPRRAAGGFTLIELLVVITLIGVLAAMAAPRFGKAIQQVKDDVAVTNLKAIWAAERYYWIHTDPHAYAELGTLQSEHLVNGDLSGTNGQYVYVAQPTGDGSGFTATATRVGGTAGFQIDALSGQVTTLDGQPVYLPY
jgi:type IV pilus assembly protein PilE